MLTKTQIKGTFTDALEITHDNCQEVIASVTPSYMRQEIEAALLGGDTEQETAIYYASWYYEGEAESRHYVLFPNAGRGGVCQGGYTEWCDSTTLDEVEAAYDAGDMEA